MHSTTHHTHAARRRTGTHHTPTGRRRAPLVGALALTSAALLAACGGSEAATDADAGEATGDGTATAADSVTVTDPWLIAADDAMSSAYGVLVNDGPDDAVLVSATTTASPEMELHETVADDAGDMVMQELDGGLTVPAGGEHVLEPGGDHLMLMDVVEPVLAGDEHVITLTFEDGSTLDATFAARDFEGGHEHYGDDSGHGDEAQSDGAGYDDGHESGSGHDEGHESGSGHGHGDE